MLMQLENVIGDVSWLTILLSSVNSEDMDWSQLNHVSREPLLFLIWEKIALLADTRNSFQVRSEAAATLGEISRHDCEHSIIEEGGVEPLLKFVGEGPIESQENAVRTLGSPGHAWESVERVILADACKVCAIILREGPMKVQAAVAWAVSEIAARHPKCRDVFVRHDVVTKNACIALTKFACTSNYFHVEVSKAIIIAGAAMQLIRLFYFGHWNVQLHALVLICYIAIHVPGSEELAQAKVLAVLKWAPKHHYFTDHEKLNKLFYAALDVPENEVAEAEARMHATYGWELQRSYMTPAETLYTLLHKATSTLDLYHSQSSKIR
ncbi:hypothetical protein ACFX1X_027265 [Malus domestica]